MASRFNIKFTLHAVDRFSKTMDKLERKLDAVERKARSMATAREVDVDANTETALAEITRLNSRINSMQRNAERPAKVDLDSRGAMRSFRRISQEMDSISNRRLRITANTRNAIRSVEDLDGRLADIQRRRSRLDINADVDATRANRSFASINETMRRMRDLNIRVDADATRAMNVLNRVDSVADGLDRRVISPDVRATTNERTFLSSVQRMTGQTERAFSRINPLEFTVESALATGEMRYVRTLAQRLDAERPNITVTADVSDVVSSMAEARVAAQSMRTVRMRADMDTLRAMAQVSTFRAWASRRIVVPLSVELGSLRQQMNKMATYSRNVGEVIMYQFVSAFAAMSTAIVPIIASTVANIANIAVMIGVAGGATLGLATAFAGAGASAVAFGLLAKSALSDVFETQKDLARLQERLDLETDGAKRIKLQEEMAARVALLTSEQQRALKANQALKASWEDLTGAMQPGVVTAYAGAVTGLTTVIEMLRPTFEGAVGAVQTLVDSLNMNLESADVQAFIEFLNSYGAPALVAMGKAAGNLTAGLMNILTAFAPLSVDMQDGFLRMSEGFRQWSAGLTESSRFESFVNYVRENWPKVKEIFGDGIIGMVELIAAFGGSASSFMDNLVDMMNRFREWSETLSSNQGFQDFISYVIANGPRVSAFFGAIISTLVSLGEAIAPLGSIVLRAATQVFEFFTTLNENHPIIAQIGAAIVTLIGVITFMIIPVKLLMAGFNLLAPVLKWVMTLFKNMSNPITFMYSIVSKVLNVWLKLKPVFALLAGPIGIAIAAIMLLVAVFIRLWNENEKFREGVMAVWEAIKTAFSTAVEFISNIVTTVVGALVEWWQANQQTFLTAAQAVWDTVYTVVSSVIMLVFDIVSRIVSNLVTFWRANSDHILNIAQTTWDLIKAAISIAIAIVTGVVKTGLGIIQGIFEVVWPLISGIVEVAWAVIKTAIDVAIDLVFGIISAGMQLISGDWEGAWETIKETAANIMDSIVSTFEGIDLWQIGKDIIQGLINGVASMAGAVVDGVSNVASGIVGAVRGVFQTRSPSRVFRNIGVDVMAGLQIGVTKQADRTVNAVAAVAERMTDAFNPNLSASITAAGTGVYGANAYTAAGSQYSAARRDRAAQERQVVEVPVYLDSREIAHATTAETTRLQNRNASVTDKFRGGGRR